MGTLKPGLAKFVAKHGSHKAASKVARRIAGARKAAKTKAAKGTK